MPGAMGSVNAGSGRSSEVDADVDSLRRVRLGQRDLGVAREAHQLRLLVGGHGREVRHVACRHHHQMAGVVGIEIEDDVTAGAANQEEIGLRRITAGAEDTGWCLFAGAGHVLESPGSPQTFHTSLKFEVRSL